MPDPFVVPGYPDPFLSALFRTISGIGIISVAHKLFGYPVKGICLLGKTGKTDQKTTNDKQKFFHVLNIDQLYETIQRSE